MTTDPGHGLSGPTGGRDAQRSVSEVEAVAAGEKYDRMTRLAELFDRVGGELRERSRLGTTILADDDVAASAALSPRTWEVAEEDIRRATTGKHGLLPGSTELDADALVVRATVLTYRWIDELAESASRTIGSIAGRAIGFLAPEVELGGVVVAAGLIETDADDREQVAEYLGQLAEHHPDLMDHISTAGGLLDGLQLRTLLTPGLGTNEEATTAGVALAGLRAVGVPAFTQDAVGAVRDVAADLLGTDPATPPAPAGVADPSLPAGLGALMTTLSEVTASVEVHRAAPGRFLVYLPGRADADGGRLRLVGGDHATYAAEAVRVVEAAVEASGHTDGPARVMLVGGGRGGVAAAEVAARQPSSRFTVEAVVTVGSPASQAPRIDGDVRVLSLEDSADPVALLGSLVNAGDEHRTSVVFDGGGAVGPPAWVVGGRAADDSSHDGLRAELTRLRDLGYLA
ncbi:hypothetical protein [Nocardioides sp. CFH 31398]|uniref:hypothetical protein n=1 Tax=Nocardioides sp. CFH 31398 TaxID=2919579 RepID=UPI001F05FEAE|nr:hypothetical protein [Nocardioides sp. CFH 31398]MCH1868826.1 hypothetical protein [Nocardioides sp. CFH 31398]